MRKRFVKKIGIFISALILAVPAGGCSPKHPSWVDGRREVPVTAAQHTAAPTSQPATTPQPKSLTPPTESQTTRSRTPLPLCESSPELLGPAEQAPRRAMELTSLDYLGGGSGDSARSETLSEKTDPQPAAANWPRLAPLDEPEPETQEPSEAQPGPAEDDETAALRAGLAAAAEVNHQAPVAATSPAEKPQPPSAPTPIFAKPSKSKFKTPVAPPEKIEMGVEQVVAGTTLQVNDQNVSVDDILCGLHGKLSQIPRYISEADFRRKAERIITREMLYEIKDILMMAEADRLLAEGAKQRVEMEMDDALRDMIAHAGNSREQLKQKCISEGTTLDDVMESHRRSFTIRIYLQSKFVPAIVLNRRMLWNYYRKNKQKFSRDKEVQMQIISAPFNAFFKKGVSEATDEELAVAKASAKDLITRVQSELDDGGDFGEVAKKFSKGIKAAEGGVWPVMAVGNFRNSQVEAAAFKLAEGQSSGVLSGPEGYYIVKAMKVRPGEVVPFEQAQDQIEDLLKERQFEKLQAEYMNKLYEKSTISQPPNFIKLAVDRAMQKYRR